MPMELNARLCIGRLACEQSRSRDRCLRRLLIAQVEECPGQANPPGPKAYYGNNSLVLKLLVTGQAYLLTHELL